MTKMWSMQQQLVSFTTGQIGKPYRRGRALKGKEPVTPNAAEPGVDLSQFLASHALDRMAPDALDATDDAHLCPPVRELSGRHSQVTALLRDNLPIEMSQATDNCFLLL